MGSEEDIFKNYVRMEDLGGDFEDRVFYKIKKKKRQRTIIVSSLGALFLGGFLFISGSLFFPKKSEFLYTQNDNQVREEVLLTDYVTFAASDEDNNYVIEQVNSLDDTGTI